MTKNALTTPRNTVPGLAGLANGLRRTKQNMPSFGGKAYLSFGKDGMWTLGKDKRTSRTGDTAILNVNSLKAGFVCWTNYPEGSKKKNEKLGEEMRLVSQGEIDPTSLEDLGWDWRQQQYIEGRFQNGDQEEFSFNTSSMGGLEMMDTLLDAIMARIDSGEEVFLYPIVELQSDWYEHTQYGKTYKPIIEIIGWADVEGVADGSVYADEDEDEDIPLDPPPAKRVAKKPAPAPEPEVEVDEDDDGGIEDAEVVDEEPEQEEAPVRRRRRG